MVFFTNFFDSFSDIKERSKRRLKMSVNSVKYSKNKREKPYVQPLKETRIYNQDVQLEKNTVERVPSINHERAKGEFT